MTQTIKEREAQLNYDEAVVAVPLLEAEIVKFESAKAVMDASKQILMSSDIRLQTISNITSAGNAFDLHLNQIKLELGRFQRALDAGDPSATSED